MLLSTLPLTSMPARLWQPYCTTSSWPPSPGHCVKLSSFTFFWLKCLEQMTESGSTSIWHWDGVSKDDFNALIMTFCFQRVLAIIYLTYHGLYIISFLQLHIHTTHTYAINLFTDIFLLNPSVLPIPVVVITGGARHDYYLIRASFDQSHPHYNSIKA